MSSSFKLKEEFNALVRLINFKSEKQRVLLVLLFHHLILGFLSSNSLASHRATSLEIHKVPLRNLVLK